MNSQSSSDKTKGLLSVTDAFLLRNYPQYWRYKPFIFLLFSFILANLVIGTLAFLVPIELIHYLGMRWSPVDYLFSAFAILVLILWIAYTRRFPIGDPAGKVPFGVFFLILACGLSLMLNAGVYNLITVKRAIKISKMPQFESDYDFMNDYGFFRDLWFEDYIYSREYREFVESPYFQDFSNYVQENAWRGISFRMVDDLSIDQYNLKRSRSIINLKWQILADLEGYHKRLAFSDQDLERKLDFIYQQILTLEEASGDPDSLDQIKIALKYGNILAGKKVESVLGRYEDLMKARERLRSLEFSNYLPGRFSESPFQNANSPFFMDDELKSIPDEDILQLSYHIFLAKMDSLQRRTNAYLFEKDSNRGLDQGMISRLETICREYFPGFEEKDSVLTPILRSGVILGIRDFSLSEKLWNRFKKGKIANYETIQSGGMNITRVMNLFMIILFFLPSLHYLYSFKGFFQATGIFLTGLMTGIFCMVIHIYIFRFFLMSDIAIPSLQILIGSAIVLLFLVGYALRKEKRNPVLEFISGFTSIWIPIVFILAFMFLTSNDQSLMGWKDMVLLLSFLFVSTIASAWYCKLYRNYQSMPL